MSLVSLDPRMNRFGLSEDLQDVSVPALDQFETYQVFQLFKEGKPFEHVGMVHGPNEDMALLFAKEQFTRRGNFCLGLAIIKTENLLITRYTDDAENVLTDYLQFSGCDPDKIQSPEMYDVFFLKKRGKQHQLQGKIMAACAEEAISLVANSNPEAKAVNVWVSKHSNALFSDDADKDFWFTLPDKKYRDAINYKSMAKIDAFKQQNLNL